MRMPGVTMALSIEENKRIARSVPEEIATERNLDRIDEVFAEDFVEHSSLGEEMRGRRAARELIQPVLDAFPDFEATVEETVAEGDLVAMRVTWCGTHEGPFMGIEPTGKSFEVPAMIFTRIADGKIAERWVVGDSMGLMTQLGVVEPPMER